MQLKLISQKLAQTRGMSLGEVVISILILSAGVIAAVSLMVYTMRLAKVSEHYATANNLARSGLELLRSKRDSNWLFQSGNIRDNWNLGFQPEASKTTLYLKADLSPLSADAEHYLGYGAKIEELDPPDPNDLTADGTIPYRLYLGPLSESPPEPSPPDLYNHFASEDVETIYYRWIKITYPSDPSNPENPSNCCYIEASTCTNKFYCLQADSTVSWLEDGEVRSTTTSTKLYDWYNNTPST